MKALLKFGRDWNWPLRITIASALDEVNSISVTYPINWEECDGSNEWFMSKFGQAPMADGFGPLPVATRDGLSWLAIMRKENNALRVILNEKRADEIFVSMREEEGIPPYLFYGRRAEIKMRCPGLEIVEAYLQALYSGKVECTERLISKEWAMIGVLGPRVSGAASRQENFQPGTESFEMKKRRFISNPGIRGSLMPV
jgi:hypothetical protein